jgi:ribosomal protein S18 acetylase RimI-like enzyme
VTADPWERIERHLLQSAFAVGCRWENVGKTFGLLVHPHLAGDWFNHLRPLEVEAPPRQWASDLSDGVARLTAYRRAVCVTVDPSHTSPAALVSLTRAGLVAVERESLMTLSAPPAPLPAPAGDIRFRVVSTGESLEAYARLWLEAFGDPLDNIEGLAELQATLRATLATGDTHLVAALLNGQAVGTGAVKIRSRVAEIIGIATLPGARQRGVASATIRYLLGRARLARADLIFLAVILGSPAQRLYHQLGFREAGQYHLWRLAIEGEQEQPWEQ